MTIFISSYEINVGKTIWYHVYNIIDVKKSSCVKMNGKKMFELIVGSIFHVNNNPIQTLSCPQSVSKLF